LAQRLNSYFTTTKELSQLSGKVRQLRLLQQQYTKIAPPSLLRASHVEQLEQQVLTLTANNSAVAAKLRQLAPELLKQLQQYGSEVTGIQVRVQVTINTHKPSPRAASISPQGKQHLAEFATSLADSPLKQALQRLSINKRKS
jgi:hypothetical protein